MDINEPIIIPEYLWTKEKIWDQLEDYFEDGPTFEVSDISDELAIKWVRRHEDNAMEAAMGGGEEGYIAVMEEINQWLISAIETGGDDDKYFGR